MLNICETCPNRVGNVSGVDLQPGEAKVVVDPVGIYLYFANTSDSDIKINTGQFNDLEGKLFPELAKAFDGCPEPDRSIEKAPNLLGALGLSKVTVLSCPALNQELDPNNAVSVTEYFDRDL